MTKKEIKELTYDERQELNVVLENWLGHYTEEVVIKVMNKIEEVLDNEMAMNMLRELYERDKKETKERIMSISSMLEDVIQNRKVEDHCLHNHALTHAKSYRDILYDMYIR